MQVVNTLKAKIVVNKKLNTVRIICAYNVYDNKFPSQRNCAYVTGDITREDIPATLERINKLMGSDIQTLA
jgi:hypothetical protein